MVGMASRQWPMEGDELPGRPGEDAAARDHPIAPIGRSPTGPMSNHDGVRSGERASPDTLSPGGTWFG